MLVNAMPQLAWSALADGYIDYYNEPWFTYTGKTREQMEGWGWQSVHHPDELPRVMERWQASLATGAAFEMSFPLRGAHGEFRWFLTRVVPMRNEAGEIVRWFGTNTDIDEQRRTELALAAALERELGNAALLESARLVHEQRARRASQAAMSASVAGVLALGGLLDETLHQCCQMIVDHIDVASARIWTVGTDGTTLELRGHAGLDEPSDAEHARIAHSLVLDGRLVGEFVLFARRALDADTLDTLARIIAVGIERKRTELGIRESEARYRFLADFLPVQVWTARPDGALDYVNQRALDYFGSRFEDTIGAGWTRFVHPEDLPPSIAIWTHSLGSGAPYEQELRLRERASGEYRWHIVRALPLRDASGAIIKWFGTNTDTEEQKRGAREHERLNHALAQSNSDLDQFAYVASHDLKAPLRGIASLTEWIEEDLGTALSAQTQEHLRLLRSRVTRMAALVDGVLDYSRVNRKHDDPEEIDVRDLIAETTELLATPSTVEIVASSALPVVRSERVPLQQVFQNLIGNAMKHARRADVRVRVDCADAGAFWRFSVSDNGPGIAPDHHDVVWGIFKTLVARDQFESTGIGLAVVKKLVTVRGGRAWIESSFGNGATFYFLWPK